jgi:hypothetical protein
VNTLNDAAASKASSRRSTDRTHHRIGEARLAGVMPIVDAIDRQQIVLLLVGATAKSRPGRRCSG